MKRCINIDWLEVHCLEPLLQPQHDAEYFQHMGYKVKVRDYGTPQYSQMFTIYENEIPFVEIRRAPYSIKSKGGIFDERSCHIRLSNVYCYEVSPIDKLRAFLVAHNYTYKTVSRIDICCDFNRFDDGGDPQEFIKQYMRGDISKVNQNRLSAFGRDTWADGRIINSLKWGSDRSPNTTKLYNKSQEMREAHDKPYIRQRWTEAGLDLSRDVWRIEFSLTSQFQTLKHKKNGEILKKSLSAYDNPQKMLIQFFYMYSKYFDFRHVEITRNGNIKPKYKCQKRMCLQYYGSDVVFTPCRNITQTKQPNRTDKILVKRLESMQFDMTIPREYRDAATELLHYFEYVLNMSTNIYIKEQKEALNEDWFKLAFSQPEKIYENSILARDLKKLQEENKERNTLKMLMRKYGIIPQPWDCPF